MALEALLLTEIATPEGRDADGKKEDGIGGQEEQASLDPQEAKAQAEVTLHQLRMDPGRVGLATMLEEMAKLRRIRELKLPDDLFPGMARKVLAVYRNRASVEEPSRLRAHSKARRLTYLSALCCHSCAGDHCGLVDPPIHIVHKFECVLRSESRKSTSRVQADGEERRHPLPDCRSRRRASRWKVAEVVFPVASEALRDVIKEYKSKGPAFRRQVHTDHPCLLQSPLPPAWHLTCWTSLTFDPTMRCTVQ